MGSVSSLKQIIESGYQPCSPYQGPISASKGALVANGIQAQGDKLFLLALFKKSNNERLNFFYSAKDKETHRLATEWCDSFIDFSKWSLKAYCRVTNLGEIQDIHIDHPSIARLYVQGVVDFIKSHYEWGVVWDENQPEEFIVQIQWTGTDRQLGVQALQELQNVFYTFAYKEKVGVYIYHLHWSDPKTTYEVGECESFVGGKIDDEFIAILEALTKNEDLRSLLAQINQYHSQTSLRSKVIMGYSLLEAYFSPSSKTPELLSMDINEKDDFAKRLQSELEPYLERTPLFKTNPKKAKKAKTKLQDAIDRMLSTKAKSPNDIMVEGISKLLGRREDSVREELDKLRSARGTLAHKLSPEMRDKFEQGLAFVDEVINQLVKQELARGEKQRAESFRSS